MGALWRGLLDLIGNTLAFFYDIVPIYGIDIILLTILAPVISYFKPVAPD